MSGRPIRVLVSRFAPPWSTGTHVAAFFGGVLLSVAVASVFCLVIERPSQRLARKIPLVS